MALSFYLVTLGCKVNQYESQALREAWIRLGWQETASPEQADMILVNSCAVTTRAAAEAQKTVRRLHRAAPEGSIVVTGCAADLLAKTLADLPGVSAVIGQNSKEELIRGPRGKADSPATFKDGQKDPGADSGAGPHQGQPSAVLSEFSPKNGSGLHFPAFAVSGYDRSRAVLKVQDGCSQRCAYCIVPMTRGPSRSRSVEDALGEAKRLLAAGFREICVSGVNLAQYGRDLKPGRQDAHGLALRGGQAPGGALYADPASAPALTVYEPVVSAGGGSFARSGWDFWDLLSLLDRELGPKWAGQARLRLSSLEPGQLGQKALDVLGKSRLLTPHLHLSLQSGSPSVLRRMGRGHYDPANLPEFLRELRRIWPVFGLGADILTGFPGESEAEFQEGLALCRALPLTYAHVFPYSRRPDTAAAGMGGQLQAAVKKERAATLRAMAQEKKRNFLRSLVHLPRMLVVFEGRGRSFKDPADEPGSDGAQVGERSGVQVGERSGVLGGGLRGVNEFYADCRLDASQATTSQPPARVLTPIIPTGSEEGVLLVRLAE